MIEEKDVVVETKDEAFWNEVRKGVDREIEALEKSLKLQRAILRMCNREQRKLSK